MELSLLLAQSILSMAIMIIVGYVATKCRVLTYDASATLSSLTLYVLTPCMIFSAYQMDFSMDKLSGLGVGIAAAIVVHILFIPMAKLISRFYPLTNIERASVIYSNAGNLIIPLVGFVLGEEYVFYTSAYVTVQTILIWTHAVTLISDKAQMNFKKIILNPAILGTIAGIISFLTGFRLPQVLDTTVTKFGDMIGPVSMLGIGIIMAGIPLKTVFKDRRGYVMCFLRLVVFPAAFILLIKISGITYLMPSMRLVLLASVLASCAPTAVSITQQARVWDEDAASASVINVMTTVLCIITMPCIVMFYQLLCW